jgi:hypothetical protein
MERMMKSRPRNPALCPPPVNGCSFLGVLHSEGNCWCVYKCKDGTGYLVPC